MDFKGSSQNYGKCVYWFVEIDPTNDIGDGDPTNDDTDGDGIPNYLDPDDTASRDDD